MTDFILWLQVFLFNYPVLQYLMIFLGAAFGGEVAMITLSFLAAQGFFPLPSFFLVSFLGTLSSDYRSDPQNKPWQSFICSYFREIFDRHPGSAYIVC